MAQLNSTPLITSANLKAYYRFESGALTTDDSGNGYTLTNTNTVGEDTGLFGGAADFSAANTNKTLSITNSLGVNGANISMGGWFKLNAEIGSGEWAFLSQCNTTSKVRFDIFYDYNSGTRRLYVDRYAIASAQPKVYHTVAMGTSDWYHLVLTHDGSTLRFFVNGKHVGSVAATGNGANSTNHSDGFSVAMNNDSTYRAWASIDSDDVFVVNTALSADQISLLYKNSPSGFIPFF